MTEKDLNEQVARKLGYKKYHQDIEGEEDGYDYWSDGKHQNKNELDFTTSIQAAWEIVDTLLKDVKFFTLNYTSERCTATISWYKLSILKTAYGEADTAPPAIVRAFLKLPDNIVRSREANGDSTPIQTSDKKSG